MKLPFRTGLGFDVHRLSPGYPLFLGGIELEHSLGLEGHSDADVIIHALCDALLGALALGDIGQHFPPSDIRYKGIDSKILLREVLGLVHREGYAVGNVDIMVVAEHPKLSPHIAKMRRCLADIMEVEEGQVSIKATTNEGLGFVGREEGICAYATTLVYLR